MVERTNNKRNPKRGFEGEESITYLEKQSHETTHSGRCRHNQWAYGDIDTHYAKHHTLRLNNSGVGNLLIINTIVEKGSIQKARGRLACTKRQCPFSTMS